MTKRDELIALADLRRANVTRQKEWDVFDQLTLAYRGNELAGEVGEACNVIKKLERERLGIAGSRDTVAHLAEELADIIICTDLIAMQAGIDLSSAVIAKFNASSEKVGLKTRLSALEAPAAGDGEPVNWREIEMVRLIDLLRSEEGDSVTILCDNPDPRTEAENNAVICNGGWTNYKDRRFNGVGVLDALSAAMIEYKRPKSDGGVEGHAIPRTTSATPTRSPETEGEEHMGATARRTEARDASTKTGPAGVEPGPSEPSSTRSEVTVESIAYRVRVAILDHYPTMNALTREAIGDAAAEALLDQFEFRRK